MNEFFGLDAVVTHGVIPWGILHIGAHYGEEAGHYNEYVGDRVVWLEAHPDYMEPLRSHVEGLGQVCDQVCLSNEEGEAEFFVTKDEYASSLLKPAYHQVQNPHAPVVGTIKVKKTTYDKYFDSLSPEGKALHRACNVLVLDVQGAELQVLEGMSELWFDAIATEYSTVEFYEGGPRLGDLDAFLGSKYRRVIPEGDATQIHADALYVRKKTQ